MTKLFLTYLLSCTLLFAVPTSMQNSMVPTGERVQQSVVIQKRNHLEKLVRDKDFKSLENFYFLYDEDQSDSDWLHPVERFFILSLFSTDTFLRDTSNYTQYLLLNTQPNDSINTQINLPLHILVQWGLLQDYPLLEALINAHKVQVTDYVYKFIHDEEFISFLKVMFPWEVKKNRYFAEAQEFLDSFPISQYAPLIHNHFNYSFCWNRSGFYWGSNYGVSFPVKSSEVGASFAMAIPVEIYVRGVALK